MEGNDANTMQLETSPEAAGSQFATAVMNTQQAVTAIDAGIIEGPEGDEARRRLHQLHSGTLSLLTAAMNASTALGTLVAELDQD